MGDGTSTRPVRARLHLNTSIYLNVGRENEMIDGRPPLGDASTSLGGMGG